IVLAYMLMQVLAQVGIALAAAVTAWVNASGLAVILWRRGHLAADGRLTRALPRMVAAAAVMAAAITGLARLLDLWLATPGVDRVAALIALIVAGMAVYGAMVMWLGVAKPAELRALLRRRAV
ncbi:MAG: lipid II flippase MurJ, partial [Alphaproteobacteria bacterium]|nr:lipid II flippase MurJ [Alphaproteobacteria bacterium]